MTAKIPNAQLASDVAPAINIKLTGDVVQVVNTSTGAVATGTTTIPLDDTIPQQTEGDLYLTAPAITPTSASNFLRIDVTLVAANSAAAYYMIAALFQDATANALKTAVHTLGAANYPATITFSHYMVAGTTSATTFKVRAGAHTAGTTTFNGAAGGRYFGGTMASSITVTEIKA